MLRISLARFFCCRLRRWPSERAPRAQCLPRTLQPCAIGAHVPCQSSNILGCSYLFLLAPCIEPTWSMPGHCSQRSGTYTPRSYDLLLTPVLTQLAQCVGIFSRYANPYHLACFRYLLSYARNAKNFGFAHYFCVISLFRCAPQPRPFRVVRGSTRQCSDLSLALVSVRAQSGTYF